MTDSERHVWARLRAEQLGVKFRRQHPLGRYIADFACLAPKPIVELDGAQHQAAGGHDRHREAFFRSQGFEVLRFPSNAPFVDLEAVLQAILNLVNVLTQASPHPCLPPEGEGVRPIHPSFLPKRAGS
ncbi:MAG: DUF559 domain-containing protein [Rhodoferax sp.]|nr:DUF559 domain-containing protein [Rhodoferax sp.]